MANISVLDKEIPASIFVGIIILAGVGAVVGVASSGTITGGASTESTEALQVEDVTTNTSRSVVQVSETDTAFVAGANISHGERVTFTVNLSNEAERALPAELFITTEESLQVRSVSSGNKKTRLYVEQTKTGRYFLDVPQNIEGVQNNADIVIVVAASDDAEPGFHELEATVRPIEVKGSDF